MSDHWDQPQFFDKSSFSDLSEPSRNVQLEIEHPVLHCTWYKRENFGSNNLPLISIKIKPSKLDNLSL